MEKQIEVVLYELFHTYITLLKSKLNITFLQAFYMMSRDILAQEVTDEVNGLVKDELETVLNEISSQEFSREQLRKTLVATTLKAYKMDNIQNSEITPDTIALLVGYLVSNISKQQNIESVCDPVVGTANLLTAVMNMTELESDLIGIDSNMDNIQLGRIFADLQNYVVDFVLEDTITSGMSGFDLIIGDVPLYIYDDEYFPHVFVNKWVEALTDTGWMIVVIPNDFFEVEGIYKDTILEKATLQGIVQLPMDMFVDPKLAKSILLVRKKQKDPGEFLMVELPSLSDHEMFASSIKTIDKWFLNKGDKK